MDGIFFEAGLKRISGNDLEKIKKEIENLPEEIFKLHNGIKKKMKKIL